jgi:hypothetical protein
LINLTANFLDGGQIAVHPVQSEIIANRILKYLAKANPSESMPLCSINAVTSVTNFGTHVFSLEQISTRVLPNTGSAKMNLYR